MANSDGPRFGSTSFSWNNYDIHRPYYPSILWDRIFEYHEFHGQLLDKAHDVATGSGAVAVELAKRFNHLYLSDLSPYNLSKAKERLETANYQSNSDKRPAIKFAAVPGEEPWLDENIVDMVTIFEGIHWMNAERAIAQAARSLKPGGTLVLLFYSIECTIVGNEPADLIWKKALAALVRNPAYGETAAFQEQTGLDFVNIKEDLFEEGTQRIYINTKGMGTEAFKLGGRRDMRNPPLYVRPCDKISFIEDDSSWVRNVNKDWFKNYLVSIQADFDDGNLREEHYWLKELESLFQHHEGTIEVMWHSELLLATRSCR